MRCNIWAQLSLGLFLFLSSVRRTAGNDPFEGNFPTLKCLKPRLITGCNGTLVDEYDKAGHNKSDQNINKADTSAFLYTRRNKECPEFLHRCNGRLPSNTNFDPSEETIILVGGYSSGVCVYAYFRNMKDQYLYRSNVNFIIIDWSWGFFPDIYGAFKNAEVVGKHIAFMIWQITIQTGVSPKSFHLLGHSIGCNILAYAGQYFIVLSGGVKLRRLTGMDPAGAVSNKADDKDILDKGDADFVDIIHTNAGTCFPFTIGIGRATGHVDYFVNGGTIQPNCLSNIMRELFTGDVIRAFVSLYPPLCFHFASVDYYIEAINDCNCPFIGVKCQSWEDLIAGNCKSCGEGGSDCLLMGPDAEYCPRGNESAVYHVRAKAHCPSCDNKGIKLQGFNNCEPRKSNKCFYASNYKPSTEICTKGE